MRSPGTILSTIAIALLASPLMGFAQAGDGGGSDPTSMLQPGDRIHVQLWQEPQLSGEYPVDESGYVSLPLVGLRQVTRRPADQVKRMLVEEYARQLRNQPAQITLLHRVRVLGAVRDPGLYHVDPTMTLGDVIARAGGIQNDGEEDSIRLYRQGRIYRTRLSRGHGLTSVRSGDEIFVPRKSWVERNARFILGAVISASALILSRQ